jgi:hypothetical protein
MALEAADLSGWTFPFANHALLDSVASDNDMEELDSAFFADTLHMDSMMYNSDTMERADCDLSEDTPATDDSGDDNGSSEFQSETTCHGVQPARLSTEPLIAAPSPTSRQIQVLPAGQPPQQPPRQYACSQCPATFPVKKSLKHLREQLLRCPRLCTLLNERKLVSRSLEVD